MKKVFDASGFPVITVRLPYVLLTVKVNARGNHAVTVWVRYLKVNLPGYGDVLSPGLCIHDCRCSGRRSGLL